ncbi:MAG: PSD1 and planctomycete cytochrome C domain-containing protein [Acidobacteria bacterium]|nr:PSD1 and planctomycete cytochrome C domain-containing protein [Acidobacteriota bacterium]MDA1235659.1 PSD1 and planctomycete cytochrome C domain-containing protein [Acidobacteriota bacterium]
MQRLRRRLSIATVLAAASACLLFAQDAPPSLEGDVAAIFETNCIACHAQAAQAGLDLRTTESILKGGMSGPAVVPGKSAASLLMDKVVTGQMPPGPSELAPAQIDVLRNWIDKTLAAKEALAVSGGAATEHDVRAIFQARCVRCHGAEEQRGGLDMRTRESRLKGGNSGPGLVPGKPEESLLYRRIADGEMPPQRLAKLLAIELVTSSEQEKVRRWIVAGAPGPQAVDDSADQVAEADKKFWSFQPPVRPVVPDVAHRDQVRNPIDAFVLSRLESNGLSYSEEADRLTLMRRVSIDLTGLPPTAAEVTAYLADRAPDAYERLVDRLLASSHYGERWGQHWLDLAGYADSEGFGQHDPVRPYAYRYRDYVIRSLNADKSYAEFLTEQIAGDEMSDDWKHADGTADQEVIDRLAATGFLRTGPDPTASYEAGLLAERVEVVAQELVVLTSGVMGVTVGCARCHDHKYDPIPQRDYYRLRAILQAAYDPYEWKIPKDRRLELGTEEEWTSVQAHNTPLKTEIERLEKTVESVVAPYRSQALEAGLASLPAELRPKARAAVDTPEDERTDAQQKLLDDYDEALDVSLGALRRKFPELVTQIDDPQKQLQKARQQLKPEPVVRVMNDNREPSVSYMLLRGDPINFGDPVEPGVPRVFENPALEPYEVVAPFEGATGRRLALARWLTQPDHPLTARVAVNQFWLRHFGRGIVPTVDNFGRSGAAPTHPELLDWLATEFVASGWSMKHMHRLMTTAHAYRQSSQVSKGVYTADPDNELLSRMRLRRMDAETLYDSLIQAAGRFHDRAFGAPTEPTITEDKEVIVEPDADGYRRSIYVLRRRQTPVSLMDAFDQPPMTPNCTERRMSNVATQALHMMNGSMTWDLSRYMAGRVLDEADGSLERAVELIYLRAFTRPPTEEEREIGLQAIEEFEKGWPARLEADADAAPRAATAKWLAVANYSHALLNSAEFSFID